MDRVPEAARTRRAGLRPVLALLLVAGWAAVPNPAAADARGASRGAMSPQRTEIATLAGGCFWCMEAVFDRLEGVERVVSGYAGGALPHPSYEQVSTGTTGYAETVQITFDPAVIPYRDLLKIFFAFHDPTTPNRQGADVGTQYRSIVFWHDPEQRAAAQQVIAELEKERIFDRPIVTQVVPYSGFVPAEDYHQGYYDRNRSQPYCQLVISPKIAKLRKLYASRLKLAAK